MKLSKIEILAACAASMLINTTALADQCTRQIEGHLLGLKTAYPNHPEIAQIETMREHMSDCEVRAQIRQLQINDVALEHANTAVEKMKERNQP